MCRRSRRRRGAAAVELALVLPLLVLIFVFAVDFARLYYHYSIVTNCARNGALYQSDPLAPFESPYLDYQAAALADSYPDLKNPTPTVLSPPDTTSYPGYVGVTVVYPFTTIISYPGLPNPINLSRTVYMRLAPSTPRY